MFISCWIKVWRDYYFGQVPKISVQDLGKFFRDRRKSEFPTKGIQIIFPHFNISPSSFVLLGGIYITLHKHKSTQSPNYNMGAAQDKSYMKYKPSKFDWWWDSPVSDEIWAKILQKPYHDCYDRKKFGIAGVNGLNSKRNKEKYKIHLYWRFTSVYLCCIKETPRRALSEYPSAYWNALKNQAQLMGTYVNQKDANK